MTDGIIVRIPFETYHADENYTTKGVYVIELKNIDTLDGTSIGTITESIEGYNPTVFDLVPQMRS